MKMALNVDKFKNWDKVGKIEFLNRCKVLCKTSKSPVIATDISKCPEISQIIYELIWSGMKEVVKKDEVVATLSQMLEYHRDLASTILDVITVIDAETSLETESEFRSALGYIVKSSERIFTEKLLKERLEIETLQEFKILSNRNFYTKFIKVKTKLYYKQKKFNLFREESEGYAKLSVELNQEISGNVTPENILEVIKSLIGFFNLDPNRVLDMILDAFEVRPEQQDFFIPLIWKYMPDSKILAEVLAFKFSFFQTGVVPQSLYTVTALMLQHGLIGLSDIYGWLTPDDKVIWKEWEKEKKEAKEFLKKLNVVSTKTDKEKDEQPEEKEDDMDKYEKNQKFNLCEALLEVGDWRTCLMLCQRLPDFCVMDQAPIAHSMCALLHSLIEPVYRKNTGFGSKIQGRVVPPHPSRMAPKPANNFLELREYVIPMLFALGPSLHHDLLLLNKVIRVLRGALLKANVDATRSPPAEDTLYYDTISLLDDVILPTLSYLDANCSISDQIWTVVKLFPYQVRYCLYCRWKNETYQDHAKLIRRHGEAQKKIKFIMKRVSKETIKPMGRHIGKLTHYSPGPLFDYMLIQIQAYDNLIVPVVDALKYLTSMSYDVLIYCIVEALGSDDRARFKHDGTSLTLWLQSLASFCGCFFKKYNVELTGLFQYVANQLKMQKSLDLLILKEVVQKMAGIEAAEEMTEDQLEAMAGGELLKGEAGYFSQVRNTKRSSLRLKEALAENNLAVALCLLMAQQRYCIIYNETEKHHLKLVGKLYDQCQDTLVQFGTFLGTMLTTDEYMQKLPSIHSMLSEYHIHMDVAFFLARPMFSHAIAMKYESLRKAEPRKSLTPALKAAKYREAVVEVMGPVATSVRPLHPPKVWEDISPQFLTTFWSLKLYDLFTPTQAYDREVAKIKQLQTNAANCKDQPANKQKKEVERYAALIEKLLEEKKKQQEHVERVMGRLKQEKDSWFLSRSLKAAKNETITQLLQLCLFPRCKFTTVDALYCAKFVHILHNLQTANFSTLLCYDRLFCDITYTVSSCTENEANRYGRFLCTMLGTVQRWHSKKEIFDAECASYPGFVTKFRVSNQFSENNDNVGYENYRHVCHKWHYKITKAMIVCLETKDYVQIRNALLILIKILPYFPLLTKLTQCIEKKIEKIKEEEKNKRQDLFTLATSYSGQLKARAPFIVREAEFHIVNEKPAKTEVSTQNVTAEVKSSEKDKQTKKEERREEAKKRAEEKVVEEKLSSSREDKHRLTKLETPAPNVNGELKSSEKEKQLKKEERREEAKKRAEEKMAEEKSSSRDDKYREERYTEMPLSKDGELVTRGTYYGAGGSYYMSHDSQLSSVSNSSSGSLRHTPDVDRESKRRKVEASTTSKKHEERKVTSSEQPSNNTDKAEKKERREKLKKSNRNTVEEEKDLKKERKLSRKREKSPYIKDGERSHDREGRDKHRRSGDIKRRKTTPNYRSHE